MPTEILKILLFSVVIIILYHVPLLSHLRNLGPDQGEQIGLVSTCYLDQVVAPGMTGGDHI